MFAKEMRLKQISLAADFSDSTNIVVNEVF